MKKLLLLIIVICFVSSARPQYTNIMLDNLGYPEEPSIIINPKNENYVLSVYNAFGQLALSINNITTGNVKIERMNLSEGLYIFQLQTDKQITATGKFIIQ